MSDASLQHSETVAMPSVPFSRVVRNVAGYGIAIALMLVSPLIVFAPAAVFHCAMRSGRRAAWSATVLGIALSALGVFFTESPATAPDARTLMEYSIFAVAVLSIAIPSMLVLPLVERREKFGTVVTVAVACGAVGLISSELIMRTVGFSPYAAQVSEQSALISARMSQFRSAAPPSWLERVGFWLAAHLPDVLPATILFYFAIFFVLSLMMYGRLSAWRAFAMTRVADSEARRAYLFRNFALPEWLLFAFVLGGVTPLLSGLAQKTAANVLTLVVSLYMLQGLAILRFMLVRAKAGFLGGLFGFFLVAMLCTVGVGLLIVPLAGLFDSFFDFRNLKRKDDSHESHTD